MTITKKLILIIPFLSLYFLFGSVGFSFAQQDPPTVTNYTYDPSGQRITVSTGGTTTVYPTKNYNTDGTNTTKHIFTNGTDAATVQGTGADAKVYYNHVDTLNSSSIITDSTGAVSETIDYFPFGAIRIDQKTGTFNEQRKYIGQEFDAETGLNYLNARYYNTTTGRFISQDPMFWSFDKDYLIDPQQWNAYSYARNNPIVGSDPSGLLTLIIPGTHYNKNDWSSSGSMSNFISSVGKTFNDTKNTQVINDQNIWSGKDNDSARQSAAKSISDMINNYSFAKDEPLNIVGHSHGGNVGILVSQMTDHKIDNLVTIGTPVISDYQPNYSMIGKHTSVYSNIDAVQAFGGKGTSLSENIGMALGSLLHLSSLGASIGKSMHWGEWGPAGRKYSGANNISSTWQAGLGIFKSHGGVLNNNVWSKVDKLINK